MPKKKANTPKQSADQQALQQRVDTMMSTERSDAPTPPPQLAKPSESNLTTLINKKTAAKATTNQKTAPELPAKLLKNIEASDTAEPPLVVALANDSKDAVAADDSQPEPESEPTSPTADPPDDSLEDTATDEAVDEIVAHEGDMLLAVDDALAAHKNAAAVSDDSPPVAKTLFWFTVFLLVLGIVYVSYRYLGL